LIYEAGEFVPLPWALDGAHTTGLYYEAMTNVTILRVPKDKLRTAMGNNNWLSQEMLSQEILKQTLCQGPKYETTCVIVLDFKKQIKT